MPVLLFVVLPILEIYAFIQVGSRFGYMNACFAILLSMVLGVGIAKSQGKFIFRHLQESVAQRKAPESRVIHSLLIFIGGVLMTVPGFITTLAGLIFILPITRHLLAFWLKARLLAQLKLGRLGVFGASGLRGFSFGTNGFRAGFRGGATGFRPEEFTGFAEDESVRFSAEEVAFGERDVTPRVIDVTPLSTDTTRPKSKPDPTGDES